MRHRDRPFARRIVLVVASAALGAAVKADDASFASVNHAVGAGGAAIYSHICQGCHMPQAQGASGAGHYPRLAGDRALLSRDYVAMRVLNGKNDMPAFGQLPDPGLERFSAHLSDAEVADVVNYVRSNFGNHYRDKITPEEVAALPHPTPP